MDVRFFSLASGSSGNSFFIGNGEYGILIDAGIGPRTIKKRLKEKGITMESIMAVLITHDHTDHIRYAGCLGNKTHIPIYCTQIICNTTNSYHDPIERLGACARIIEKDIPFTIRDFKITCFETPHDGTDNVGYYIEWENDSLALATDLGHISPKVDSYLSRAQHLVIEANYDHYLLEAGNYPQFLKNRIVHKYGHLCNNATAEYLSSIAREELKHIFLCHLSQENNTPFTACKIINDGLASCKHKPIVIALPRKEASELYYF